MRTFEIVAGALSAVIVVFIGLLVLPAIATATGQSPFFGLSLMIILLIVVIIGAVFAIFRSFK